MWSVARGLTLLLYERTITVRKQTEPYCFSVDGAELDEVEAEAVDKLKATIDS